MSKITENENFQITGATLKFFKVAFFEVILVIRVSLDIRNDPEVIAVMNKW